MSANNQKTLKDLPLYLREGENYDRSLIVHLDSSERGQLEATISSIRQGACQFMQQYAEQKEKSLKYYESCESNVKQQLNYLRSDTNIIPKVIFISLSGFGGVLLGFRRTAFRKFIYGATFATGAAALCYPNEAKLYSNQVTQFTKAKAKVFYNDYIWPDQNSTKKAKQSMSESKAAAITSISASSNEKDKIVKMDDKAINKVKSTLDIKGDKGQSRDEDKDMYTTRSK
jgi:hypothetical protein